MNRRSEKIAVVGAGPIGLEAALTALESGYEVTVFERGEIADAVRQWGHVRMFSPFSMNASQRGRARLEATGAPLPPAEALLNGAEFRDLYLRPLAELLRPHIRENTTVLAIGRSRRLKGDFISDPERGRASFRLLARDRSGERIELADIVLDCSGTFAQANSLGDGGIAAPGEAACVDRIHYGIPNLSGKADAARYTGKRILVVGAGHSAATTIRDLARLPNPAPATEINWMIRRGREVPAEEIGHDPLPERQRLTATANRLVQQKRVRFFPDATIDALVPQGDGIEVRFSQSDGEAKSLQVDLIVAATGFRPDLSLARELQLQTCWATEGTYPLAASLLGEVAADCLTTPVFGAETLLHPEPGYFTLGIKSYGRAPNFLLRTGYEQVASVFDWLNAKAIAHST